MKSILTIFALCITLSAGAQTANVKVNGFEFNCSKNKAMAVITQKGWTVPADKEANRWYFGHVGIGNYKADAAYLSFNNDSLYKLEYLINTDDTYNVIFALVEKYGKSETVTYESNKIYYWQAGGGVKISALHSIDKGDCYLKYENEEIAERIKKADTL